jgi:hypothetical protein
MPDREASRHPSIPNAFHIEINADMAEHFPHQGHIAVVLNDRHAGYRVFHKAIPLHLKGRQYDGKEVHWVNNFGLKKQGQQQYSAQVPEYTVMLNHIENAAYVLFDGKEIRPLAVGPHEEDLTKVKALLGLGDPPIGWVR